MTKAERMAFKLEFLKGHGLDEHGNPKQVRLDSAEKVHRTDDVVQPDLAAEVSRLEHDNNRLRGEVTLLRSRQDNTPKTSVGTSESRRLLAEQEAAARTDADRQAVAAVRRYLNAMDEEDRIHRGPEEALSPRDRFERACRAQGSRPLDKGGSR